MTAEENKIKELLNSPNLTDPQRHTLKEFEAHQREERQGFQTRKYYIFALGRLGKALNRPFEEIEKVELTAYVLKIRETYKPATSQKYVQYIRRFYRWLLDPADEDFPDLVRGPAFKEKRNSTKAGNGNGNGLTKDDLLNIEEIEAIIEAVESPMYKALYGMMIDSGGRIAREILALKIGDIQLEPSKNQYKVKLAERTIICIRSYPILTLWMDLHRHKDDPTAPLFHSELDSSRHLPYSTLRSHLIADVSQASKKCPSLKTKKVYLHLFRHSAATSFAAKPGVSDVLLNQRFGWIQGSGTSRIYIHLADTDVEDLTRMAFGEEPLGQNNSPELLDYVRVPRTEFDRLQNSFQRQGESRETQLEELIARNETQQSQVETLLEVEASRQDRLVQLEQIVMDMQNNTEEGTE